MASPDRQSVWLHPVMLGLYVGTAFCVALLYAPLVHRLQVGEWEPADLTPLWVKWALNITGAIFAGSLIFGFIPDRVIDRVPNYVTWPLLFNGGIWLGISLWFWMVLLVVGANTLFYRLPGKYFNMIAVAALPVGYFAYRFKRFNQTLYGIVEIMAGVATAFGSTLAVKQEFDAAKGLAVLSAMYVVARGFNNIHDHQNQNRNPDGRG